MTMTYDDVAELLAFCAVYDQRKGDELDIKAWLKVAELHRWTTATTTRIALEHYGSGADKPRLEPRMISDELRKLRGKAAESFEAPRIPDGLPNHEYPRWLRAQLARHIDAVTERWAVSGEEPSRSIAPAAGGPLAIGAAPEHLREQLARDMARFGSLPTTKPQSTRQVPLDPHRRASARAELDSMRRTGEAS
jgi:hypothetical protein